MKAKKVLAMLMASAMIMGTSVTAFAAENSKATIEVSGLAATGTNSVEYVRILEPDVTAETGYKFAEGVEIDGYTTVKDFLAAELVDQKAALLSSKTKLPAATPGKVENNNFTAEVEAGYYMVTVTNSAGEGEKEVVYTNPMIVSVEYTKATEDNGEYTYNAVESDNSEVIAKYEDIPTIKTGKDTTEGSQDDVVEIGGTATYEIVTYVPSEVTSYKIIDKLTDATYNQDTVKVEIEGVPLVNIEGKVDFATENVENADESMTIDLSDYLTGNAGKKVTITYDVTVTGTKVGNTVIPNDGKHNFEPDTEELYTGAIQFTKYGEEDKDEDGVPDGLAGAVFNVKDSENNTLKFTWNEEDGVYYLDPTNGSEDVTSGEDGIFNLYGLNLGTYEIVEIEAPEGYSVNTASESVTINKANTTAEVTLTPAQGDMTDTKLTSLPSTGGIGTTIFTIGGCAIMVTAAGLYFATRRKTEK